VVQETWLAAPEERPREVRRPGAWLATVVRNIASRRYTRECRRAEREHRLAEVQSLIVRRR